MFEVTFIFWEYKGNGIKNKKLSLSLTRYITHICFNQLKTKIQKKKKITKKKKTEIMLNNSSFVAAVLKYT